MNMDNCCKYETDHAGHLDRVRCAQCGKRWSRKGNRWEKVHQPSPWSSNPDERTAAKVQRDLALDRQTPRSPVEAFRKRILKALLEGMTTESHVVGIEKAIVIVQNMKA